MKAAALRERPEHYNPLLITVLPKERRSRHPYQLGAMMCLLTLGVAQIILGTVPTASVNRLDTSALWLLNWVCVVGGLAGILAAIIPERVVGWRVKVWRWVWQTEFDATYFRLWEEFGCHFMLFTVWLSYGQTVWVNFGIAKGYSFGLAASVWFGGAAIVRSAQILLTLYRAGTFNRSATAIVSDGTLDTEAPV